MRVLSQLSFPCLALLGQLVGAQAVDGDNLDVRQSTDTCSRGPHIIAAPGRGDNTGSVGLGLLDTLFTNITTVYPNYSSYMVTYNYSTVLFNTVPPQIVQHIENYTAECPNTPLILIGYSIGGIVELNALCGGSTPGEDYTDPLDSLYASHIAAVITYGEESRAANQTWDKGDCQANAPSFARTNPAGCDAFAKSIQDYCNANDGLCCTGGDGGEAAHYVYGPQYDLIAMKFIKKRMRTYRKKQQS